MYTFLGNWKLSFSDQVQFIVGQIFLIIKEKGKYDYLIHC